MIPGKTLGAELTGSFCQPDCVYRFTFALFRAGGVAEWLECTIIMLGSIPLMGTM